MFYFVLKNIFACLLISLAVTGILTFIFWSLPKWSFPRFTYQPLHYIALLIVFIILFIQIMLFTGACYLKSYVSKAEEGTVSVTDLLDKYPAITEYTDEYIDVNDTKSHINQILDPIRQYLNSYLWKRVIWVVVVSTLLIVFLAYQANMQSKTKVTRSRSMHSGRRGDYDV